MKSDQVTVWLSSVFIEWIWSVFWPHLNVIESSYWLVVVLWSYTFRSTSLIDGLNIFRLHLFLVFLNECVCLYLLQRCWLFVMDVQDVKECFSIHIRSTNSSLWFSDHLVYECQRCVSFSAPIKIVIRALAALNAIANKYVTCWVLWNCLQAWRKNGRQWSEPRN